MKTIPLFIFACLLAAQTPTRTVTLTWEDTRNPTGTTYNVYRASGACSVAPDFAKVNAAPITAKTYDQTGVVPGKYCYVVRAEYDGMESGDSNQATAQAKPFEVIITVSGR